MYRISFLLIVVIAAMGLASCEPVEPARVELPVIVDGSGLAPTTTDLGYEVELSEARMVFEDLVFTVRGEAHRVSLTERLLAWIVPNAWAHPGHYEAGEVAGELRGRFVVDWTEGAGQMLGVAILLEGRYQSANLTFARGNVIDGLDADDSLLGHTAELAGVARRDGVEIAFRALIASPPGRELIGVPFDFDVSADTEGELGLALMPTDPFELDSLFDGIDFFVLPEEDGEVFIVPDSSDVGIEQAYNRLRRTFQTHDHFLIQPLTP